MTEERLETLLAYALILVFLRAGLVIVVAVSSEHFSAYWFLVYSNDHLSL